MAEEAETIRIPKLLTSAQHQEIDEAFIKAQGEFTTVPKNREARVKSKRTGAEFTYRYADLADVLGMAIPVLAKNGIGLMQPHLRVNGELRVCTRLIHGKSGEWLMSDGLVINEGLEPQDMGGESTYFRRYDACSLLGIVADEDVDGVRAGDAPAKQVKQPQAKVTPASVTPAPPPKPEGSAEAVKVLQARDEVVAELKKLIPDAAELGQRAKKKYPQHKDTRTLTVADLEALRDEIRQERTRMPADVPPDVAAMFDDGRITTASKVQETTIGPGRAKRLLRLLEMNKIHTKQQLEEEFMNPLGIAHPEGIMTGMYEELCAWAEGRRESVPEVTSGGD